jgi:hypothetical protein
MLHVNRHVAHSHSTYRQVPSLSPCLNAALLAECTWIRPRLPRLQSFIKEMPSWNRNPTVRPHTSHCALRTVKRSKFVPVQWDRLAACLCCINTYASLAVQVGSAWISQTLSTTPSPVVSTVTHYTILAPCPRIQEIVVYISIIWYISQICKHYVLLWAEISGGWGFPTATLLEARAY